MLIIRILSPLIWGRHTIVLHFFFCPHLFFVRIINGRFALFQECMYSSRYHIDVLTKWSTYNSSVSFCLGIVDVFAITDIELLTKNVASCFLFFFLPPVSVCWCMCTQALRWLDKTPFVCLVQWKFYLFFNRFISLWTKSVNMSNATSSRWWIPVGCAL